MDEVILSRERLQALLAGCARLKIGVIGDLALDAYWHADMTRAFLSRETPRFPRPIVREVFSGGAGANVANNLARLGVGEVRVFSVLGEDWRGGILSDVLASAGVNIAALVTSPQRCTTAYIKPILTGYDSQQEDARLDFENDRPLSPALEDALIERVQRHLPDLDALLVSDQMEINGVITPRVRDALNALVAEHPAKWFVVDSRRRIGLFEHMVLKPNRMEAQLAQAPDQPPRAIGLDEATEIGMALHARSGRPTYLTLSEDGVLICAEGTHRVLPAAPVRPPLDPVGAGDAFMAALAAALAGSATPWEAGAIATLAAGVVIEKLNQTGSASPDEILVRYDLSQETRP
jgi:rfaE bifunctional protein kinase chain/domain